MKKLLGCLVVVSLLVGVRSVLAGGACCASKSKTTSADAGKKVKSASSADECMGIISKLDLTEDQKTRLAALKDECDQSKCSESGQKKLFTGIAEILTADQLARCKSLCDDNGWQCPLNKKPLEKSSLDKSEAGG
jgi:hypothetical protein